tara:strand:- start:21522 stop:24110 length:2589 start_codon:yes stop_codon:yes gene_type:complete
MAFKKLASSPKLFVILLIIATALLIFIGSISYKQISELGDSADSISHTLEVQKEINHLFFIYSRMESAELKNLLKKDTLQYSFSFQKYLIEADSSLSVLKSLVDDNPIQQNHLTRIGELQKDLVNALKAISSTPQTRVKFALNEKNKIDDVSYIMAELSQRKNFMLNKEDALLIERKNNYESQAFFTPLMILFLGMFALFIFIISFLKLNSERKNRSKAEAFLESVMFNTENIINYYEPIYNDDQVIIDFELKYANERNRVDFGLNPKDIIGKRISKIFPFISLNGEYEKLTQSFNDKKIFKLSRQVFTNGKKIWLDSLIRPLNNGVLVVAKNINFEKDSVARLNDMNDKLQKQFEELKNTEAFLQSILKSTSNVIAHYKPIRNTNNKIIDFSIAYTNEVIREATGDVPEEIKNKKISDVYPFLMENGVFDTMVQTVLTGETLKIEKEYDFLGAKKVFLSTSTKIDDGVTLTSRENTLERLAEKQMNALNEKLKIQNAILKEAKAIAKIGSYSWDIIDDNSAETKISDNLYSLLDCEPNDFIGTHKNYKNFIHSDDLEYYELSIKQAIEKNKPIDFIYRVITKTKKIKHFRTAGNIQGHLLAGVIQDVTSIIKGEQKIKEKNQELKRSNAELESFNRVASHDLQEPIRKIQMFISRIADADLDKLSDRSKDYFEKINNSSERMRMLIKYLLSYSRINKTKKDFESVNLNTIIDKVKEDLEARIKESRVTILVDNLPHLKAIPFQMEQLFNNLISNAIKYRALEDPKIIIDCKKLKKSQITDDFIKKNKAYYRISVLDNGIGFNQEHAEKIFELFQRLHQKNEYSGTGIGLAICKKIAQNHGGHIVADSEPGKGSSFCVYLPA